MSEQVKRYWAFASYDYYPAGGMSDSHAAFDTQAEAEAWAREHAVGHSYDWVEVWDLLEDRELVTFRNGGRRKGYAIEETRP